MNVRMYLKPSGPEKGVDTSGDQTASDSVSGST